MGRDDEVLRSLRNQRIRRPARYGRATAAVLVFAGVQVTVRCLYQDKRASLIGPLSNPHGHLDPTPPAPPCEGGEQPYAAHALSSIFDPPSSPFDLLSPRHLRTARLTPVTAGR